MTGGETSARLPVLAAVLICMSMVAIEATIVTTAMPSIARELGGFDSYGWVFSAYFLAQTATTLLFGKLADVYGRKRILFIGLAIFAAASFLAGSASSMLALAIFRGLQGVGAGCIHPVAITVVGDLYRGAERGRIQGYFLGVWVASSLLGPPLGSLITQYASGEWVFWLNLPFCAVAAGLYLIFLKEKTSDMGAGFDGVGSLLLIVIGGLFVAVMVLLGSDRRIDSAAAVSAFLLLLAVFLRQQGRIANGIMSLHLWRKRPILAANCATFLSSILMAGLSAYLPLYLQTVMGETPSVAGLTLSAMLLSWQIAAMAASRTFHRFGFRLLFIAGGTILPVGTATLLLLGPATSAAIPFVATLVTGLGIGLINMTALLMVHEILSWSDRASATAANLFSRNLGMAVGAFAFGLILNSFYTASAIDFLPGPGSLGPVLEDTGAITMVGRTVVPAFDSAASLMFLAMLGVSIVTMLSCFMLPKRVEPG